MPRRLKEFTPGRGYTKEDWDEVSDSPELTEDEMRQAKPFAEVFPEMAAGIAAEAALAEAKGGAVISLPLDRDVLEAWLATGPGWKDRMNAALRAALAKV